MAGEPVEHPAASLVESFQCEAATAGRIRFASAAADRSSNSAEREQEHTNLTGGTQV